MKKTTCFSIITLSLLLISSCTLYDTPEVPDAKAPAYFKPQIKLTSENLKDEWWENFYDDKLNELVHLAVQNNYNYEIALKNIDIASTYVSQNISNLFPQVNMTFNSSRNKSATAIVNNFASGSSNVINGTNPVNPINSSFSNIFNLNELTGTASYQVDLWNQIRNSVKQARANQAVSEADSRNIKLMLISSVVSAYYQIKCLNENLPNLKNQLKSSSEIVKLLEIQYRSGLIDYSEIDAAKNQVEIIKSNISNLSKQKEILYFTLAYLLGQYPENYDSVVSAGFGKFRVLNAIPAGIPAKMVGNRPDIQDAYYQVLSYGFLEKESIANFLPAINLTANYGYASSALANLISGVNSYWNYGLFATQFIFDYQTRMSEYQRAKYQYESAILNYKNVLLNAFKEVDSALVSYKEDNEALRSYKNQYRNFKDLLMISNSQYQSGLIDYSSYLTSKINYLQGSYNLSNQQLAVVQDVIQVYVTLGMGV